jgi:hypothetical protein
MIYKELKNLKDSDFKRLTGVKRTTFEKMIEILSKAELIKKSRGGKPSETSLEDKLLMTLEYWREYRTYFHISVSYGVSESQCFRNIKWIEDVLIKDGTFALPSKKELSISDNEIEVIVIDASEHNIERPKKNKENIIQERKKDIH